MTKLAAAIDLGTNTFHLLIKDGNTGRVLLRRVDAVKLGEGGIDKGFIADAAFDRGLAMLREYSKALSASGVQVVHAIGTSALRNAANGRDFIEKVREETGIKIRVINGDEEARYIYQGVRAAGCLTDQSSLLLDIGGGSVECIICNRGGISWKQSFEIGAARLLALFHKTDPVPPATLLSMETYLNQKLAPLIEALQKFPSDMLIGSSGAFESFAALSDPGFDAETESVFEFDKGRLNEILSWLAVSSHTERVDTGKIVPVRTDMIVTAGILTRFVIAKAGISRIIMTTYSLKEGVISELTGDS